MALNRDKERSVTILWLSTLSILIQFKLFVLKAEVVSDRLPYKEDPNKAAALAATRWDSAVKPNRREGPAKAAELSA